MMQNTHARRASTHKEPRSRAVSDVENQVVPFHLDDGTDDNEEIRQRRYSSSSSSDSEAERRRGASAPNGKRPAGPASARRRPTSRQEVNEWDKASSGRESSSSHGDNFDSNDESEEDERPRHGQRHQPKSREQPESPRRVAGRRSRKTQQSDEEEEDNDDSDEEGGRRREELPSTATTTNVPSSTPSTPRIVVTDLGKLSKLAIFPGSESQLVQGHIVRVKTLLHSQYHYFINDQLVLMAEKQFKNRTPNYHIFDMTRAAAGLSARLTKKSGNYIGKVRSNFSKKKNVLIGNQSRKTELGVVIFSGNTNSTEPRRLAVVLPPLNAKRQEVEGIAVGDEPDLFSILAEQYKLIKKAPSPGSSTLSSHRLQYNTSIQVFENKEPVFENGFYRLNFNGRVSVPSVKNFQLVKSDPDPSLAMAAASLRERDSGPIVYLQFGKVDEKKFHLDFRAPIAPIQAFAIALAQFNL